MSEINVNRTCAGWKRHTGVQRGFFTLNAPVENTNIEVDVMEFRACLGGRNLQSSEAFTLGLQLDPLSQKQRHKKIT